MHKVGDIVEVPQSPVGFCRFGIIRKVEPDGVTVECPRVGSRFADMLLAVAPTYGEEIASMVNARRERLAVASWENEGGAI